MAPGDLPDIGRGGGIFFSVTATDEMNDLKLIAVRDLGLGIVRAWYDFEVAFEGNLARVEPERLQKLKQRERSREIPRLAVDDHAHVLTSRAAGAALVREYETSARQVQPAPTGSCSSLSRMLVQNTSTTTETLATTVTRPPMPTICRPANPFRSRMDVFRPSERSILPDA